MAEASLVVGSIIGLLGTFLLIYASRSNVWCCTEYPDDPKRRIHRHHVWSPYYRLTGGENKGKLVINLKHYKIRGSRFTPKQIESFAGILLLTKGVILQII